MSRMKINSISFTAEEITFHKVPPSWLCLPKNKLMISEKEDKFYMSSLNATDWLGARFFSNSSERTELIFNVVKPTKNSWLMANLSNLSQHSRGLGYTPAGFPGGLFSLFSVFFFSKKKVPLFMHIMIFNRVLPPKYTRSPPPQKKTKTSRKP